MPHLSRRGFMSKTVCGVIGSGIAAGLIAPKVAMADMFDLNAAMKDRVLGNPDAPNVFEDFSSLTCPHCREFHENILPKLKAGPVAAGKLQIIYRDFPLNGVDIQAAMMARCAPPQTYFSMIDVLFATQDNWTRANDPLSALLSIGQLSGMSRQEIETCWQNTNLAEALVHIRQDATDRYNITGTPGLVMNGENISHLHGEDILKGVNERLKN